jgi:hypothetical protein
MFADHDPTDDYDETPDDRSRPLDLGDGIRVVICVSDRSEDLAGRVQRAIGEHSRASDELHVSHAIAPDARGVMLYTALIVLRPPRDQE